MSAAETAATRRRAVLSSAEDRMARAKGESRGVAAAASSSSSPRKRRPKKALARFAPAPIVRSATTTSGSGPSSAAAAKPRALGRFASAAPRMKSAAARKRAAKAPPPPPAQRLFEEVYAQLAPAEAKMRREADADAQRAVQTVLAVPRRRCALPSPLALVPAAFLLWGALSERAALAPLDAIDAFGLHTEVAQSGFAVCFAPVPLLLTLAVARVALACRAPPCPLTAMRAFRFTLSLIGSVSRDLSLCVFCAVVGALAAPFATVEAAAVGAALVVVVAAAAALAGEAGKRAALRDAALARLKRPHFVPGKVGATLALPIAEVRAWAERAVGDAHGGGGSGSDRRWAAVCAELRQSHGLQDVGAGHWIVDEVALSTVKI